MPSDIRGDRLSPAEVESNFADLHPLLSKHEAVVEADRCYFCHDAPCVTACPTGIDIPLFIRQILTDNPSGSAKTILSENILGGMCARVCPTETLCEQACVREIEQKPVRIGELQRYATDHLMEKGAQPFERAQPTGKTIAVVGAGPAGLSCAHRLAMLGHDVTIFEAKEKGGGLNEYGIAAYKAVDEFAQKELDFVLSIGGIDLKNGMALGQDVTLDSLVSDFDAVFLGLGLGATNGLGVDGEDLEGVADAVDFIEELRQAPAMEKVAVGSNVVVIGGGMTAIDAAVQSKLLGADEVTLVYRRGADRMNASPYEQSLAKEKGVVLRHWARPEKIAAGEDGKVGAVSFARTKDEGGKLADTGAHFTLEADMVLKAIGQTIVPVPLQGSSVEVALEAGRIKAGDDRRTSHPKIWAGGDAVAGGEDLTVAAVEDGKQAALSIHNALTGA
ncbi:NAD(P)-dependent oxidoreductase [Nisaea sp.]|uniref:NAD(P)-dependent oxidoreductase n=1 Tax=Nisaea sp. TaxID=2024842 RepID=UPI0032EDEF00